MTIQTIKGLDGKAEYILLPVAVYRALREKIEKELAGLKVHVKRKDDFVPFDPADYVKNPLALARIRTGIKQVDLARRLGVSQAYLSKVERAERVSGKLLARVLAALAGEKLEQHGKRAGVRAKPAAKKIV